jgi:hypothetical protein
MFPGPEAWASQACGPKDTYMAPGSSKHVNVSMIGHGCSGV